MSRHSRLCLGVPAADDPRGSGRRGHYVGERPTRCTARPRLELVEAPSESVCAQRDDPRRGRREGDGALHGASLRGGHHGERQAGEGWCRGGGRYRPWRGDGEQDQLRRSQCRRGELQLSIRVESIVIGDAFRGDSAVAPLCGYCCAGVLINVVANGSTEFFNVYVH